uniref:Serpentine Receptor, class T n=1 Tax=Steinernema glaseri TaxID=37863 RepID=A0A1I7ZWT4_9BILA
MELYLFRPHEYERLYRCDMYSDEQWKDMGHVNIWLGWFYLISGVLYMVPYIPCLTVMTRRELFKHSCYKIMAFLGVIDFLCLFINGVVTGFMTIQGAYFCSYPNFIYIVGAFGVSLWCMACMTCALLAFNRCVDVSNAELSRTLFYEWRTFVWLLFPIAYFLYFFFFTQPLLYTSAYYAWFFDPYAGVKVNYTGVEPSEYHNWPHSLNNFSVVACLLTLYCVLSVLIWVKTRSVSTGGGLSHMQKQIIFQSCTICMFNFIAAIIYVYMQFFETPTVFVVLGQVTWQASHGGAAIVYLFMNKTIRKGVIDLLTPEKLRSGRIGQTTEQVLTISPTT